MNPSKATYKDIADAIADAKSILITSHRSPDGDSIGSQLGLYEYISSKGKGVIIINQDFIPYMYHTVSGINNITNIDDYNGDDEFDTVIVLDSSNLDRCGKVRELIGADVRLINIDHHSDNNKFGDIILWDETASSTSEILTEFLVSVDWIINQNAAVALYMGIMTDTGRFRFESTGRRTMELAGLLIEKGAKPRTICDEVYFSVSPSLLRLTGEMLVNASFYNNGKICIMEISQSSLNKYNSTRGDLDTLAEYTLYTRDVAIGALLKELTENSIKVSLRSRGALDISTVAHEFGGGGHRNAAGFEINLSLEAGRKRLVDSLKDLV